MRRSDLTWVAIVVLALAGILASGWAVGDSVAQRYSVEGWTVIGVWQQNYGIDVQNVIEEKDGKYRVRWVSSADRRATKSTAALARKDDTFARVGSPTKDVYKILANGELACYDKDGFIENLKPVR